MALHRGLQITLFLKPLQQRIQTSGTDAVTVMSKLLDHAEAENRPFNRMVENVQADKPRIKITIRHRRQRI